jgi:uncharacterized protein (TIGR02147 family)
MKNRRHVSPSRKRIGAAEILNAAFKRKRIQRPEYSKRALARDLGVSPAFVTNLFKGKKTLPNSRLLDIIRILELDIHERNRLIEIVALGNIPSGVLGAQRGAKMILGDRHVHEGPNMHLLANWYNLALLEGLDLEPPHNTIAALKKRLRLTNSQIENALDCLIKTGTVEVENGQFRKVAAHLYIPSGRSKKEIRQFHEKMILKAREQLMTRNSDQDFQRRLITGFTFSVDQDDIEELKAMIMKFLNSLSRKATKVRGTDIFQCNLQFFPLTAEIDGED